jgi:signal transduction histidine kinase
VEVDREGAAIVIRVRDRGLGIPAAEHRGILRKFVRGTAAHATGIKGTGIGLAMVKHIVDAHGGSLRLESVPGAGSTFSIVLPAGG